MGIKGFLRTLKVRVKLIGIFFFKTNGDWAQMRTPSGSLLHVTNIPYKEVFSFDDSRKTVLTRKLLSWRSILFSVYPTLLIDTKFIFMSACYKLSGGLKTLPGM